ncbi:citryl-CoA lyase [Microbaculum marinum]|uniref:citrate synthase (unknown stereospecificity) n=1 Tax=Microbaculum marinum TaxID=1764581 RepID=A0AAW9RZE5_9HYPH
MAIGKHGAAQTSICTSWPDRIEVRGRDLCNDLMGHVGFTDYFFLLVTGRMPTPDQSYFLDTLLVAIAEHGLTPTAQAARMTYDADPAALQAAVAAGILGCGSVLLGTSELCGKLLVEARRRVDAGEDADAVAESIAREYRESRRAFPGFGHPVHKPVDPRTVRIFEMTAERGIEGPYIDMARRFPAAVERVWGKPLTMNVQMPIAAVLLELDFPASVIKAIAILARTGGLLAHLAEESDGQIGFLMASHGEDAIAYVRQGEEGTR